MYIYIYDMYRLYNSINKTIYSYWSYKATTQTEGLTHQRKATSWGRCQPMASVALNARWGKFLNGGFYRMGPPLTIIIRGKP